MIILKKDIETLLRKEDVESLIGLGATDDEYSNEAEQIYNAIKLLNKHELNQDTLTAIISIVWAKSFNRSSKEIKKRLPAFQRIVKNIL